MSTSTSVAVRYRGVSVALETHRHRHPSVRFGTPLGGQVEDVSVDATATSPRLYDGAEHEALRDVTWSSRAALDGAAEIVHDALHRARDGLWPLHPDDAREDDPFDVATCVYFGAAGVTLALDWLAHELDTPRPSSIPEHLDRLRATHASNPSWEPSPASWLLGRAGVAAVLHVVDGAPLEPVLEHAATAIDNATHDPLTGAGHALTGLVALHARVPDARIVDLVRAGVDRELAALATDPAGTRMWHVDLYGTDAWLTGAGHGAAGSLQSMLQGAHLLDDDTAATARTLARDLVVRTALRDGDLANWAPASDSTEGRIPVQWCHGAPGVLLALADAARGDDGTTDLLRAGGELTWRAGPLRKGSTICHGTARSALALLRLFELTQDELWLERARLLAMHALDQVRRRRAEVGHGRYSLITGDLGVATCLVQCERVRPGVVGLDLL